MTTEDDDRSDATEIEESGAAGADVQAHVRRTGSASEVARLADEDDDDGPDVVAHREHRGR